ncbi:MAG: hypothetical protein KGM44_04670 [bacterium]|nr:hypothetical protein [bacterium]
MTMEGLNESLGPNALASLRRLTASMWLAADDAGRIASTVLSPLLEQHAARILPNELLALLLSLGVLREVKLAEAFDLDPHRIAIVEAALQFAQSAGGEVPVDAWFPVATMPLKAPSLPAFVQQTAGVVFSLLEEARRELWLVTPFLDSLSVAFLRGPIASVLQRGAAVKILTSEPNASFVDSLVRGIPDPDGLLCVWFADNALSDLGTHAKSVVTDRRRAYLGSANLTSYGMSKHFEIGALLEGPSVGTLVSLFERLAAAGRMRCRDSVQGANPEGAGC